MGYYETVHESYDNMPLGHVTTNSHAHTTHQRYASTSACILSRTNKGVTKYSTAVMTWPGNRLRVSHNYRTEYDTAQPAVWELWVREQWWGLAGGTRLTLYTSCTGHTTSTHLHHHLSRSHAGTWAAVQDSFYQAISWTWKVITYHKSC